MKAIMYHYVRPDDPQLPHFKHLHVEDFEKQLDYFAEHGGFVSKELFRESLPRYDCNMFPHGACRCFTAGEVSLPKLGYNDPAADPIGTPLSQATR